MHAIYAADHLYCRECGTPVAVNASFCSACAAPQALSKESLDKFILPAVLLGFFLGFFSAHRFYVGKPGTAILQIITLGGLGLWWLIDMIMLTVGAFRDGRGRKITRWT